MSASHSAPFAELIARLRAKLAPAATEPAPEPGVVEAAVLMPLIARDSGVTVLLTHRAADLRSHSGQIAFPGGRRDATDASLEATALRESHEEIGLAPDEVLTLGALDPYITGTGYRVTPIIGLTHLPTRLALNPAEVASVFECPLAFLMQPGNQTIEEGVWRGEWRQTWVMTYEGHRIWGVTAGIIRQFYERIYG